MTKELQAKAQELVELCAAANLEYSELEAEYDKQIGKWGYEILQAYLNQSKPLEEAREALEESCKCQKAVEQHVFPEPHHDEGCTKCGGFEGEPCEPPTGDGKALWAKHRTRDFLTDQNQVEQWLISVTQYDGYFSKQQHTKILKWLANKVYENTGLDVTLTEDETTEDFRSFKTGFAK